MPQGWKAAVKQFWRMASRLKRLFGRHGGVRWAKGVPFGEYVTNVVEVHQMEATDDAGAYYGQFMTDLKGNDALRAPSFWNLRTA